jgi:SAM-dependent methyltransferase
MTSVTKERQNSVVFDVAEKHGTSRLGLMANESWNQDPNVPFLHWRDINLLQMLAGSERVLEVGCADAFGTRLVQQTVAKVTAVDFDPIFIDDATARADAAWPMECFVHDLLDGPVPGQFDAIYSLDVLEDIRPENEGQSVSNMLASLDARGVMIIGMPLLESRLTLRPRVKRAMSTAKRGGPQVSFKKILPQCFPVFNER